MEANPGTSRPQLDVARLDQLRELLGSAASRVPTDRDRYARQVHAHAAAVHSEAAEVHQKAAELFKLHAAEVIEVDPSGAELAGRRAARERELAEWERAAYDREQAEVDALEEARA